MAAVVAKGGFDKGWAKAEWKLPEKGHLVLRKNAAGWEPSVFLPLAHLYLCPCLSIFAYINAERHVAKTLWFFKNIGNSEERNVILAGFWKPGKRDP